MMPNAAKNREKKALKVCEKPQYLGIIETLIWGINISSNFI